MEIVLAYCSAPLDWLVDAVRAIRADGSSHLAAIHIMSKCDMTPDTSRLPAEITHVRSLPNLGRCDHTFAHYLAERYDTLPAAILFLKDTALDERASLRAYDPFQLVESLAASPIGFICGHTFIQPWEPYLNSSWWHVTREANEFQMCAPS